MRAGSKDHNRSLRAPTSPSPPPSRHPSLSHIPQRLNSPAAPEVVIKREYFSEDEPDEDEDEDELDDSDDGDDGSIVLLGFGGVKRELDDALPDGGGKVPKLASSAPSGVGQGRGRPRKSAAQEGGARRKASSSTATPRRKTAAAREGRGRGKKWTGADLEALLRAAAGDATPTKFEGKVPGRTASQCYLTWRHTVQPAITKFLLERGGGGGAEGGGDRGGDGNDEAGDGRHG